MRRLYKFFPIFFLINACGSQDYGEPTAKAVEEEPYFWEDAVENSRLLSLAPVRGPSTKKQLAASGLKEAANCPTDSVCLRNPYMGSKQLTGLAATNSLFDLSVSEEENIITYKGPGLLFIEAEVVELPGNLTLRSCAEKTVVSAREIQGTGTIRTNSPQCESVEGGDLILSALTIDRLSVDSSGSPGTAGVSANSSTEPVKASDGSSSPVQYSIQWGTPFKGKLCVTELACHWDGNSHPDLKYEENMNLLRKSKFVEMDKIEKFIKESSEDGRYWYCWIENVEDSQFYKNLYLNWKITADFSPLKGQDATVFSSGANGGDGGNAGDITIVALEHYLENFSSAGGAPGNAGLSFAQEPGKGAQLLNPTFDTEDVIWGGAAHCGKKDRDLNGNPALYMSRHFTFGGRKKLRFTVGEDYESPVEGSKILGHELEKRDGTFYGPDGVRTYTSTTPSTGNPGQDSTPRLRIMSNLQEFGEAANDELQGASLPKSITLELEDES